MISYIDKICEIRAWTRCFRVVDALDICWKMLFDARGKEVSVTST